MKTMLNRYKRKVIDKTSDALSFPWRYSANRKMKKADKEFNILRTARQIPSYAVGSDYRDENFRMKAMADDIKINKRYQK